jgi:ABC-type multidrug transport system permease subunit
VQNIAFGGFVTALGLNEDLHKGLIDRFRSLPMARPTVLAGRTFSDAFTNSLSVAILLVTGVIIGFSFNSDVFHVIAGILLLLLFGYAFSWVFAFVGLIASTPESANSVAFIAIFPLTLISSAFVPVASMPEPSGPCSGQPVHDHGQRDALAVARPARRQLRVGAVACAIGITVVFAPLAVSRYRKHTGS